MMWFYSYKLFSAAVTVIWKFTWKVKRLLTPMTSLIMSCVGRRVSHRLMWCLTDLVLLWCLAVVNFRVVVSKPSTLLKQVQQKCIYFTYTFVLLFMKSSNINNVENKVCSILTKFSIITKVLLCIISGT